MVGVDGCSDALVAAMEFTRDLRWLLPLVAGQENLAAAQGEGIGGVQAFL